MAKEITKYEELMGLDPSALEKGTRLNLLGGGGQTLGYKELQNVIQDPTTGLYQVTFGRDIDPTGKGNVQGGSQTLLMTKEGKFIDWSGRPADTATVSGNVGSALKNYQDWLSSGQTGYSPEYLAQAKQDVTLRGTELGPEAGSASVAPQAQTQQPQVSASMGDDTNYKNWTITGADGKTFTYNGNEASAKMLANTVKGSYNLVGGGTTQQGVQQGGQPGTQTGTQARIEVPGFPKSSVEYEQWISQGRKFDATTGKWYEGGDVTAGVAGVGTTGTTTGTTGTTTVEGEQPQTVSGFVETYKKNLEDLGISSIKESYNSSIKEHTDLTNEMNDKIADINEDPWKSESVKNREKQNIKNRYEVRLNTLVNEQQLFDSLYKQGIAEAKYLTTGAIEEQNALIEYAQKAEEAKAKLQQQAFENKQSGIRSVNGGLYDINTNTWLVLPKTVDTGGAGGVTGTTGLPVDTSENDKTILTIDDLLKSGSGILEAVGPNIFARLGLGSFTGKTQNFVSTVEQIVSQLSLESLINAKSRGATFGALSDREMNILANAATKIGGWAIKKDGKTIGYNIDENSFKKELQIIKDAAEKDKQARLGNTTIEGYLDNIDSILKNAVTDPYANY